MRTLQPYDLQPGMKLIEAVITPSGQVLAPAGSEITRQLINRMKLYRVASAVVEGEDISAAPVAPVAAAPVSEPPKPRTYINESKTAKQKVASSDAFHTFQMQYAMAMEELKKVFTDIADYGKEIEPDALLDCVADLFRSRNTITELFDMLNNTRTINDSVYAHSVNVA